MCSLGPRSQAGGATGSALLASAPTELLEPGSMPLHQLQLQERLASNCRRRPCCRRGAAAVDEVAVQELGPAVAASSGLTSLTVGGLRAALSAQWAQ